MWRRYVMICAVFVFSLILLTQLAWATCEQEDLAGTWDAVICASDDCFGESCVECLQLQIDSNGMVVNTGASIETLCGSWTVTGGELTIYPNCIVEGHIETSNGTLYLDTGSIVEDQLVLGTGGE